MLVANAEKGDVATDIPSLNLVCLREKKRKKKEQPEMGGKKRTTTKAHLKCEKREKMETEGEKLPAFLYLAPSLPFLGGKGGGR